MHKNQWKKNSKLFLSLFSFFVFLPLLFSFSTLDSDSITESSQVSAFIQKTGSDRSASHEMERPLINQIPRMESIVLIKSFRMGEQKLSGFENFYYWVPFPDLINGLSILFLSFGMLAGIFFVCKFNRHIIIPHSIHAPPYTLAETV